MKRLGLPAIGCLLILPSPLLGQSAQVPKTNPMKVYAHYMPWFQTPQTLGANNWGWHWRMNTRNPNVIEPNGQRQIASHYYPLTGPYDSTDRDTIEYHMLLMKVSGIDGVIIDWYGSQGTNGDIGSLLNASNTIVSKAPNYGMKFAVCLEDRFAASTNDVKANINYARQNYFTNASYIRVGSNNAPLMPIFGPVQYHQPSQWSTIMSGTGEQPALLPLWYQSHEVGAPAKGEQAWIYQDQGTSNHLSHQQNFLANRSQSVGLAMSAIYPGFNDYYQEGGAGSTLLDIPSNNGQTLASLLALNSTYAANIDMVQLATFNDFGEGTMFEPTVETGFSYLQQVQQFTGVSYGLAELELVFGLYDARKDFTGNAAIQSQLDQVANSINQLNFVAARTSLDAISAPRWALTGGGNWHTPGNWGGSVANGIGATAIFGSSITAPSAVSSDVGVTVGTLTFDNANTYTLAGAGSLTLQAATGSAAAVNVVQGTHRINLPVTIASDTTIDVAPISGALTLTALQSTSRAITKAGAGNLTLNAVQAGSLTVNAGTVTIASASAGGGPSSLGLLSIAPNATLDLNDNDLLTSTDKATIEAQVRNARNNGTWNQPGVTSTAARNNASQSTNLGVISGAEYSSAGGTGTFAGRSYAASDTLVKYTWNGDTNFSGTVNFDDYVRTDVGFNTHLTGWVNGDFNYSGSVDFDDYVLIDIAFNTQSGTLSRAVNWLSGDDRSAARSGDPAVQEVVQHFEQFGLAYANAFLAAVPEPASLAAVAVAAAFMAMARRSRR